MEQDEIWDEDAAASYDTPGTGMFSADVLHPAVDRLVELAGDGRALELAIGTGRVAVPLLQRGVPVSGIESSRPMLARLRRKVDEAALPVVLGDMSSARAPGAFSLVYLVCNTIANLLTQDEQVACFGNAARHLSPGGRFVVELWVPELRALPPGRAGTVGAARRGHLSVDTYDVVTQRVVSHHVDFSSGREARLFRTPHRYVWPSELDLMGRLAGFRLESRHADWTGSEFMEDSPSHVSVYRLDRPSDGSTSAHPEAQRASSSRCSQQRSSPGAPRGSTDPRRRDVDATEVDRKAAPHEGAPQAGLHRKGHP